MFSPQPHQSRDCKRLNAITCIKRSRGGPTRTLFPVITSKSKFHFQANKMPLYLCVCPDYPNVFEKRLAAREAHLAGQFRSLHQATSLE